MTKFLLDRTAGSIVQSSTFQMARPPLSKAQSLVTANDYLVGC
jgi:hypothetical protein